MKKLNKLALLIGITLNCGFGTSGTFANNLVIANTSVEGSYIRFDISWENSWRVTSPPYNWDAAWVFVKYAECGVSTQVWHHATLSPNAADDSCNTKLQVIPSLQANDSCLGVYIVRDANNTGGPGDITNPPYSATRVRLTLNIPAGTYNFRVFGIEMVYTPSNNFQVGDGASLSSFNNVTITSTHETVDNALTGATLGGGASNIPAIYPVGWQSFYCMKYEISQEQYVDFLNTLTYDQQAGRTAVTPSQPQNTHALTGVAAGGVVLNRNGIMIQSSGNSGTSPKTPAIYGCNLNNAGTHNQADDGQNVACNYLSWGDLTAYLDWACLRPMSELEYEKECRGADATNGMERPWGTASSNVTTVACANTPGNTSLEYSTAACPGGFNIYAYRYTAACAYIGYSSAERTVSITAATSSSLNFAGQYNEVSTATGNGLCAVGGSGNMGPLRVGFAATGTTNRVTAGSSYYGALDLAGNVWERTVAADATGITFNQDSLGNGELATNGDPDVGTWPSPTTAAGTGRRGGAWNSVWLYSCGAGNDVSPSGTWYFFTTYPLMRTSNRRYATTTDPARVNSYGGRGVRKGKGVNN